MSVDRSSADRAKFRAFVAGNPSKLHHPRTGAGLNAADIAYEFGQSRLIDVTAWLDELVAEDHVSIRAWRDSMK